MVTYRNSLIELDPSKNMLHGLCGRSSLNTRIMDRVGGIPTRAISTGPRSAVGNVSGNRCESDCRSRGREFDPGPVPYFRGD